MLKAKLNSNSQKTTTSTKPNITKSTPTIIAKDFVLEGEVKSAGIVEIEGKINGKINGHIVVIRESGFVDGEINADSAVIKGSLNGNLSAKTINISSKARVLGNIQYGVLSVDDGASIEGSFKKISDKIQN